MMFKKVCYAIVFVLLSHLTLLYTTVCQAQSTRAWKIHDSNRPLPPIINPGTQSTQEKAGQPPAYAIVLFYGTDLSQWHSGNGEPAKWRVENGYMECVKGKGPIYTKQKFGDCQLHVEWAAPVPAKGKGQDRGNSGVFLMTKYEIQVLDSYENETYADGQAAAIYSQYPPLVNVCRPPGEWQTYDIIFHRPHFDQRGILVKPARITLLHNGVLVHDNAALTGPTTHKILLPYQAHADKLPIFLQDHSNPVRYRNIWIIELAETCKTDRIADTALGLTPNVLDRYVGKYRVDPEWTITVTRDGDQLLVDNVKPSTISLSAQSEIAFFSKMTSTSIKFDKSADGKVKGLQLYHQSGKVFFAEKID